MFPTDIPPILIDPAYTTVYSRLFASTGLIRRIFTFLDQPTLARVCLVNWGFLALAGPVLYAEMVLSNVQLEVLTKASMSSTPPAPKISDKLKPYLSLDLMRHLTYLAHSRAEVALTLGQPPVGRPRGSLLGNNRDPASSTSVIIPKRTVKIIQKERDSNESRTIGTVHLLSASKWRNVTRLTLVETLPAFHAANPVPPTTASSSVPLSSPPNKGAGSRKSDTVFEPWSYAPPSLEVIVDLRNIDISGVETVERALGKWLGASRSRPGRPGSPAVTGSSIRIWVVDEAMKAKVVEVFKARNLEEAGRSMVRVKARE